MAAVKVGINGFGRIGRIVFRQMAKAPEKYDVVGINDLTDTKTLALLLKYDSSQGRFDGKVEYDENNLIVNGKKIPVSKETKPSCIPWKKLGAKIVLESTGFFTAPASGDKEGYDSHDVDKVVISAPAKGDNVFTCVLGVNDEELTPVNDIPFTKQQQAYYTLSGIRVNEPQKGVTIVRDSNGRTYKIRK